MAQRNTSVVHQNEIGTIVIESAIAVHREPGPGLFELKSVRAMSPPHTRERYRLTQELAGCRFGYLLNFPTALMKDDIVRAVNGLPDQQRTEELRASASLRAFQKLVNRYDTSYLSFSSVNGRKSSNLPSKLKSLSALSSSPRSCG